MDGRKRFRYVWTTAIFLEKRKVHILKSRVRVIGDLTVSLFADLHGYCLLKQKAL